MMAVHPDQADLNLNYRRMTYRAYIRLSLDVDGICVSIDTHMLNKKHSILAQLEALYNGIKPYICPLNKDRGNIFLECCAERFKEDFYVMSMKYYLKW